MLVEMILRLAGSAAEVRLWQAAATDAGPFDFHIVCVGDSHTAGVCASPGLDWPSQLRAMLRAHDPARRYQVTNLGRSGSNSSEAVERVQKYLATAPAAPDLVIFQAGHNNDHNFRHAGFFAGADPEADRRQWARYFLAESRASRLGFITRQRLRRIAAEDRPDNGEADSFLNIRGQAEQELLRNWLLADLRGLRVLVEAHGGKLVLLDYFAPVPWVDEAPLRCNATTARCSSTSRTSACTRSSHGRGGTS
jgi:lysophospholipase L1-like esterase